MKRNEAELVRIGHAITRMRASIDTLERSLSLGTIITAVPGEALIGSAACQIAKHDAYILAAEDFLAGVVAEKAHQAKRWTGDHDKRKSPADWFWLLGYLSGKALAAHIAGNREKALHHCISSAAVLSHWHDAIHAERP